MKKITNLTVFSLLVFSMVFGNFFLLPKPVEAAGAPVTIFSENFGTGNGTSTLPSGWSEGGNGGDDAELRNFSNGNDSASLNGGRFAVALGDGGYLCHTVNTTGYNNVNLSYYWRGDSDSNSASDDAKVEIKSSTGNNCSDGSGWTELQDHDMRIDSSWSTQSAFTNSGMNNTSFLIRFRVSTNQSDEHFRVDGILITGEPIVTTGNINVTKTTVGGNGTFSFTGNAGSFNITTASNTGSSLRTNLNPGTYNISETVQSGWDITSNNCTNLVVTAGNTLNCEIVNTKRGSITVYKNVLNPNGDEVADNTNFSVNLDGANTQNINEGTSYTYANLVPGTYTITETSNANYDFLNFSSDSDTNLEGAQVVVSPGVNTDLTITNKQKVSKLYVTTLVDNSHGLGSLTPSDFTMNITGTNASPSTFSGGSSVEVSIYPGSYSVNETLNSDYAMELSANCTGTISSNESKSCTVTNYDLEPGKGAIIVNKTVLNDHNGNLEENDFALKITPSESEALNVTSGAVNELNPGTYTVSEIMTEEQAHSYTQDSLVCTLGETTIEGNTITLEAGQVYYCTVTNNDKPATLKLIKNTINNAYNGTLDDTFIFNVSNSKEDLTLTTVEGMASTNLIFDKGTHTITETLNPLWNLTGISCGENSIGEVENGLSITLDNGDYVECTFTNTRKVGTLTVNKTVVNDDNMQSKIATDFGFTVNDGELISFIQDGEDASKGKNTLILQTGTYSINEPVTDGYYKITNDCNVINIDEGDEESCSFRNDDVGFFVHNGGGSSSLTGSVLGASTENTETTTTEEKKEEPKTEGKVLGETTCNPYLNSFMKFGAKNDKEQVKLLQSFLNENLGLSLKVDGIYGVSTKNAVIKFQEKYKADILDPWIPFGLKDGKGTGAVYKTTLWKINALKCEGIELPKPQLP